MESVVVLHKQSSLTLRSQNGREKRMNVRTWAAALTLSALLFVIANTGTASSETKTVFVDSSQGVDSSSCFLEGSPCRTFQFALSIAAPGDTVCLKPGSYSEDVRIQKEVSLCGSGRVSSVVLERGARVLGTSQVAADKVRVMPGARFQDGVDLAVLGGVVSLEESEYESVTISRDLTILGVRGRDSLTPVGCPTVSGGSVVNARGQPFGVLQAGAVTIVIQNLLIVGAEESGLFFTNARQVKLDHVYTQSPRGAVGMYALNVSRGSVLSGSACGSQRSGQGIVLSGTDGFRVQEFQVWNYQIGLGVVGYREFGDVPKSARGNISVENMFVLNSVGVRVEGYSELTSFTDNSFYVNSVGFQSVGLNRDGFEHSVPRGTTLFNNVFLGNGKNAESFVLGSGSADIEPERVDARWNWWGTFTGPKSLDNPRGAGPGVEGPVVFGPWCATPSCEKSFSVAEVLVFVPETARPTATSFTLTVEAQDFSGNIAVNFVGVVRLRASPACGQLRGPVEVVAVNGRAVFPGLSLAGLRDGCEMSASSGGDTRDASSRGVFTPVASPDPSSVAPPPQVRPEPDPHLQDPDIRIPGPNEADSFVSTGDWSSAVLATKIRAGGCQLGSLLMLTEKGVIDYIDQLSGRIDPSFPAVIEKGTTLVVWCK